MKFSFWFLLIVALCLPGPAPAGEKLKPIMSAKEFTGDSRRAYELAAKYASTLPHIKCHCGCMEHMHHMSLHDCFSGDHGDECHMCRAEVFRVAELKYQGKSDDEVAKVIEAEFNH